jgi:hypothetical protein
MRRLVATGVALVAVTGALAGQGLRDRVSSELFTFGTCGQPLCLDGSQLVGHGDHFIPAQLTGAGSIIAFLSNAIAVSVSNVPVSAASSGATFSFVGGQPVKTSSSAGPIFGERAQTLGRGRFFIGANITGLHFERLRGIRLDNVILNFGHQNIAPTDTLGSPDFENDIVQVRVGLDVDLLVSTVFASWGIVDGVDLGVAVPFVHTSVRGQSAAQILPFGSGVNTPHYFGTDGGGNPILSAVAQTDGSATGIGDVAGRIKISLIQTGRVGIAMLADARFPTGDEANLLGSGKFSGRGMGIVSVKMGSFSPHANVGYVIRDADFENNGIVANVGFDQLVGPWATMAFDLLSEWEVGEPKLLLPGPLVYQSPFPRTVPVTEVPNRKDNQLQASLGFKFTTGRGLTLVFNGLIPLRDAGLQPSAVWTGGLEYNF